MDSDAANVHVHDWLDFDDLLPRAVTFLHHGGQNSVMTGFRYEVPQLVYPGTVFERRYNAETVERVGAGIELERVEADIVRAAVSKIGRDPSYVENARGVAETLHELGGPRRIVAVLADRYER